MVRTRPETGRRDRAPLGAKIGETRLPGNRTAPTPSRPVEPQRLWPPEGSLSPTSRKPPEYIQATKEIRNFKILLLDFQVFHGFYLASTPITTQRHKVKLTPEVNFWCLDSCALCFCLLFCRCSCPFCSFTYCPFLSTDPNHRSEGRDGLFNHP